MRERDCASKIAAFTPPPWRQSMRGKSFELGVVDGSDGMIALVVSPCELRNIWRIERKLKVS